MSHSLFESLFQTTDRFKEGPNYLLSSKSNHGPYLQDQVGKVAKYYPEENMADVWIVGAGDGPPVKLPVMVHYRGAFPGTGEAYALKYKDLVKVKVGKEGVFSEAVITGTHYTPKSHPSPNHPMWVQKAKKGQAVKITMDAGEDGEGNISITDINSNTDTVTTGHSHKEMLGSESTVISGDQETQVEADTKKMATTFSDKAKNMVG